MTALTPLFFYDEQIRRFLLQFARIFSNFQVEYGRNEEGTDHTLVRVPVKYGDWSRQAQTVLQNNSASTMPSTPQMTFYITGLDYDRPRIQEPYFVSKIAVRQRTYDEMTDSYETTQGNAFTIERLMPVPYKLTLKLDIWTSNTNQKMQLLEQMLVLFNPSLELQGTDNYIDWTSLTVCELESVQWTSRTIPQGTENPIDIATLTFNVPIWISSPAKVKKLGVVERIIANVFDAQGDASNAVLDNDLLLGTRQVITPYSYQVLLIGNRLQALQPPQVVQPPNSSLEPPESPPSNLMWQAVVGTYGVLRSGISFVRLEQEDGSEIVGTVAYDPTDDRFLLFDLDEDTAPANTLPPVNAVINPLISGPGEGLAPAAVGQRYLLTEDSGSYAGESPVAWQGINGQPMVARANDIIEYDGTRWAVAFDQSSSPENIQYVTNLTTNIQYKWINNTWVKSYEGLYPGGQWSLVL
jgi:T4-like virus Myoviridae tail sheath stabiliser